MIEKSIEECCRILIPIGAHKFNVRLGGITLWWEYFIAGIFGLWKQMLAMWEDWCLMDIIGLTLYGWFWWGLHNRAEGRELPLFHSFGEAVKEIDSFLTYLTCYQKFSVGLVFMAEELKTKISLVSFANHLFFTSPETGLNLLAWWYGGGAHIDCWFVT